jgi:threonine dehydrogenase-like Zn-dependent dehydrogenase
VADEISIIGSRCGHFAPAIEMLVSGAVRTEALVEGVFELSEFDRAYELADGGLKVLMAMGQPRARDHIHD